MSEQQKGNEPITPKKPNFFRRILAFLVTLALVLGAVLLVVHREDLNFDAIRRHFAYRDLAQSDSGQADSFRVDNDNTSCYADVNGDLLLAFSNGIRLYSGSGNIYVNETVSLEHPMVQAAGKTGLVYDVGGQELLVYSNRTEVFSLTLEENRSILSARVNDNGWLTVTAQESGHKGAVTVYNSSYQPVMQVSLSSRFIMDAVISPDNSTVAVLTIGVDEREFESRLDFYVLTHQTETVTPSASCVLGNSAILDLLWETDGIWALGDTSVTLVNSDASIGGSYSYIGRYLKDFSLRGSGTAVLLLGKYRAGSNADLCIVDSSGQIRASVHTDEQVLWLSAAGRYISVLTADRLDIYDQDMVLYSSLEGTQGARKVLQREDGSAMLIGSDTAQLYLPK